MGRKKKSNCRRNLYIFLGLVVLTTIIYFSVLQAFPFDNTAEKHFSFTDGEDVAEGYTLSDPNSITVGRGHEESLNLTGSSYIVVDGYTLPSGGFSFNAWVYPENYGYIFEQFIRTGGYNYGGYSQINTLGGISLALCDNGDCESCNSPNYAVNKDEFFYYTADYNSSTKTFDLYVNGVFQCSETMPNTAYLSPSFGEQLIIGGGFNSVGTPYHTTGEIDEVSIYHHPIGADAILEDFNEQKSYFIKYDIEFYHHRDINITGLDNCETTFVNDLERTTFCDDVASIGETIQVELLTTRTVLNPTEDFTILMDGNKYLEILSNDTQVVIPPVSSGGGGGSSEPELEIVEVVENETIIPEEFSITGAVIGTKKVVVDYWAWFLGGLVGLAVGGILFYRKVKK